MKKFIAGLLAALVISFTSTEVKAWPAQDTVCLYYYQVNTYAAVEAFELNDPAWYYYILDLFFLSSNFLANLYGEYPDESQEWYDQQIEAHWSAALTYYCSIVVT